MNNSYDNEDFNENVNSPVEDRKGVNFEPKRVCGTKKRRTRKVHGEWGDDKTSKLISFVEQRRALWMASSAEYKSPKPPVFLLSFIQNVCYFPT